MKLVGMISFSKPMRIFPSSRSGKYIRYLYSSAGTR